MGQPILREYHVNLFNFNINAFFVQKFTLLKGNQGSFFYICYKAFWSIRSFQFKQRIKLRNQSPVWSDLLTVGSGCWLIDIRTESPLESCCLLFPSNDTHALLRVSTGIWLISHAWKTSQWKHHNTFSLNKPHFEDWTRVFLLTCSETKIFSTIVFFLSSLTRTKFAFPS